MLSTSLALRQFVAASLLLGCGGAADPRPGTFAADASIELPRADASMTQDVSMADRLSAATDDVTQSGGDVRVADASGYPEGPYGSRVGSTLADLSWEGYVNPQAEGRATGVPYGPTSLGALRGAGRGYAMVFIAEFL